MLNDVIDGFMDDRGDMTELRAGYIAYAGDVGGVVLGYAETRAGAKAFADGPCKVVGATWRVMSHRTSWNPEWTMYAGLADIVWDGGYVAVAVADGWPLVGAGATEDEAMADAESVMVGAGMTEPAAAAVVAIVGRHWRIRAKRAGKPLVKAVQAARRLRGEIIRGDGCKLGCDGYGRRHLVTNHSMAAPPPSLTGLPQPPLVRRERPLRRDRAMAGDMGIALAATARCGVIRTSRQCRSD